MADAFTDTSAQTSLVQGAVDRYVRAALRPQPMFRSLADTRPVQINMPGESVNFYIHKDLATATTPLTETTDPDAVALGDPDSVTVTLNEYGLATISTIRLQKFSFSEVEPNQMDQVAYNLRNSMDELVVGTLSSGDNVLYGGDATSTATLAAGDNISSAHVRRVVTELRSASVEGRVGDLYAGFLHPRVAHDLKAETGELGWRDAHKYAAPGMIWPNTIGVYEGCTFVETPRTDVTVDGGAADEDTYASLFMGKEALAEAVADEPHVVVGPMVDKLRRFYPLGWTGILGWNVFREKALWRVETTSGVDAEA